MILYTLMGRILPNNIEVFTLKRPSFTAEFKRDSANLVINQGYGIREASEAVGVSQSAMRKWVIQLREEQGGVTPKGSAITPEQQKIQELEAKIKRIEREKEILKKATALLISDSIKQSI